MRKRSLMYGACLLFMTKLFLLGCVDPIAPEFDFKEGLVYVDALIATTPDASQVKVSQSIFKFDKHVYEFLDATDVFFREIHTERIVVLTEQEGAYLPPEGFAASEGESWELLITLPDGRRYKSLPETVSRPVPVVDIRATYNPELFFRESNETFLPGHFLSIDIADPADGENYYFWNFRSFEKLRICELCFEGFFRDGECQLQQHLADEELYVRYRCENSCWRIRFAETIKIFSDEFTNGTTINTLPVADVLLYSKEDVVVVLQQHTLSKTAYEYYKVLKDVLENNGGINAPPPAALIGNMYNPDDDEEFVLGRFTALSTTTASVFIDRTDIPEDAIGFEPVSYSECCPDLGCVVPVLDIPCIPLLRVPCTETRFKTAIEPPGWIEQ